MEIDAHELTLGTKADRDVMNHRCNCPKWGKEFCLDCFGGGLHKWLRNLFKDKGFLHELKIIMNR
jgi:hypothetical protein